MTVCSQQLSIYAGGLGFTSSVAHMLTTGGQSAVYFIQSVWFKVIVGLAFAMYMLPHAVTKCLDIHIVTVMEVKINMLVTRTVELKW